MRCRTLRGRSCPNTASPRTSARWPARGRTRLKRYRPDPDVTAHDFDRPALDPGLPGLRKQPQIGTSLMPSRRQLLLSGAAIALAGLGLPALAAGRFERVLARLRRLVDEGQLPFASIRLARQGEVLAEAHVSGIETIGPHSLYRIHSMTKPLVAAAVVLLVEDGKLALEDQVERYVPEFADLKVGGGTLDALEPARPMRVAQLLTHSCGLAN